MGKGIGSVALDLTINKESFSGLQKAVSDVVSGLDPIKLKLDVKGTTEEFNKLSDVIKEVAENINKINTSALASGGVGASTQKAKEQAQAYREIVEAFDRLKHFQQSFEKLDATKDPFGMANALEKLEEYKQKFNETFAANKNKLSDTQIDTIQRKYEVLLETIDEIRAHSIDQSLQKVMTEASKEQAQATKEAAQAQKEAELAEKERANILKSLYKMLRQVRELEDAAKNGAGGTSSQTYTDAHALGDALEDAISRGGVAKDVLAQYNLEQEKLKLTASSSGDALKGMTGAFDGLESRLLYMFSLTNIITQSVRQFKEMFNTVVELDSAMTQLRIVTDNTDAEYASFGKNTAKVAQEIGASTQDLINSTTTFARLGYSLSESGDLARLTAMLSKVGDVDVTSAQNAITAITKAFSDVDTSNIESAMDKMVEVGEILPKITVM